MNDIYSMLTYICEKIRMKWANKKDGDGWETQQSKATGVSYIWQLASPWKEWSAASPGY